KPRRARRKIIGEQAGFSRQGRRNRKAAIADDFGGDSLADFRFRQRIERQGEVGVGVNVDEAGRENSPRPVDLPRRAVASPRLDGRNASVADGDIQQSRRASRAVDDSGAADYQIVHVLPPPFVVPSGAAQRAAKSRDLFSAISGLLLREGPSTRPL